MESIVFAQKFPFSNIARDFLKGKGVSVDEIPETAIKRAALMVMRAFSSSTYSFDSLNPNNDALTAEIMAFPVAKMFVSSMNAPNIAEKFSVLIKNMCFSNLIDSNSPKDLCVLLADDFKIPYSIENEKEFTVKIPLMEYLKIYFADPESRLVNKSVSAGNVFLNLNDFARFLSEKAYSAVFDSLPIPSKSIPKSISLLSKSIESQLVNIEKKNFDFKLAGKIDPNLFPPCMSVLYSDQLGGKKLSYMGRLALASFLYQLGMSKTEMVTLFSKSPDYKKHIADYHINRIFEKQLSAPGCTKMFEYGLKIAACEKECKFKHPFRYYLSKLRIKNRIKNSKSAGEKNV